MPTILAWQTFVDVVEVAFVFLTVYFGSSSAKKLGLSKTREQMMIRLSLVAIMPLVLFLFTNEDTDAKRTYIRRKWESLLKEYESKNVPSEKLGNIIDLIEDLFRVSAPQSWKRVFLTASSLEGKTVQFDYRAAREVTDLFTLKRKSEFLIENSESREEFAISTFFNYFQHDRLAISRATDADFEYVAIYDSEWVNKPTMLCYDRENRKLVWEFELNNTIGSCNNVDFGGFQHIAMAVNSSRVVMFGIGYHGFFVIDVDKKNGKSLRFLDSCVKTSDSLEQDLIPP